MHAWLLQNDTSINGKTTFSFNLGNDFQSCSSAGFRQSIQGHCWLCEDYCCRRRASSTSKGKWIRQFLLDCSTRTQNLSSFILEIASFLGLSISLSWKIKWMINELSIPTSPFTILVSWDYDGYKYWKRAMPRNLQLHWILVLYFLIINCAA